MKMFNRISDAQEKMMLGLELSDKKEIAKIRREQKVSKKEAKAILENRQAELKAKQAEEARLATEKAEAEKALAESLLSLHSSISWALNRS